MCVKCGTSWTFLLPYIHAWFTEEAGLRGFDWAPGLFYLITNLSRESSLPPRVTCDLNKTLTPCELQIIHCLQAHLSAHLNKLQDRFPACNLHLATLFVVHSNTDTHTHSNSAMLYVYKMTELIIIPINVIKPNKCSLHTTTCFVDTRNFWRETLSVNWCIAINSTKEHHFSPHKHAPTPPQQSWKSVGVAGGWGCRRICLSHKQPKIIFSKLGNVLTKYTDLSFNDVMPMYHTVSNRYGIGVNV